MEKQHHNHPPPYSQAVPPQQGYPPMGPPPPMGMNIPAAVVMPQIVNYGPDSQATICPHCHAQIRSSTKTEATTKTHISALLLCCFLCWPCACLPYCMDSCQNVNHYCPNCQAFLGSYQS